jgi:predicted AAA+ superfamily ATPase
MIQDIFALQNPWRYQKKYKFNYLPRIILPILIREIKNPKIIGLVGSRQVGKSSLLFLLIQQLLNLNISKERIFYFNLDDLQIRSLFANPAEFIEFIGNAAERQYIFIDEIQRLENPGLFLKELYDLKLIRQR